MLDEKKAILELAKILGELRNNPVITSESQLAYLIGVSQPTINKLILGKARRLPDFPILQAIATYLNMPVWQLIKNLEEACPFDLDTHSEAGQLVGQLYRIKEIDKLAMLLNHATGHLNALISQQKKK